MRKRILVVHDAISGIGGSHCVAAWAIQALAQRHAVTLLTRPPHDLGRVDALFGTRLLDFDIEMAVLEPTAGDLLRLPPFRLALLRMNLLFRRARRLIAEREFDAVLSTMGEMDLGRKVIQYVHYPWLAYPRPDYDLRGYHLPALVRLYRACCLKLSDFRPERAAANLTLVNSDWIGALYTQVYGRPAVTVYPPAPGPFKATPWTERADTFLCIGRLSPEKELLKVMRILAAVRARGHEITLSIIGNPDDRAYQGRIEAAAAAHGSWVKMNVSPPRPALLDALSRARYGIHGMAEEHFGIAVAEMVRAGCLPFVPDGGGAPEIVGRNPALLYGSEDEAADRISRVLGDVALQEILRQEMAARADLFSENTFMRRITEIVDRTMS